jgi:TRAP-type C4-dicarboxylate transport system substrate-binding protein
MQYKYFKICVMFFVFCTFAGCKKDMGNIIKTKSENIKWSIKIADTLGDDHPMSKALDEILVQELKEKSGGRITASVKHKAALGNEADLWDAVCNGTLEMAVVGAPMKDQWQTMYISEWPFLYRDIDHAKKVWTGNVSQELNDLFHQHFPNVYILAWGPETVRVFSSNKTLEKPQDFKGQIFRMPEDSVSVSLAENLGASAIHIPIKSLKESFLNGVADGQDNSMAIMLENHMDEVQRYLYETQHIITTMEIIVSADFMNKLTDDLKDVVRNASQAAALSAWNVYITKLDSDRSYLQAHNVVFTKCTQEDKEEMLSMLRPLTEKLLYEHSSWAPVLVEKIKAVN